MEGPEMKKKIAAVTIGAAMTLTSLSAGIDTALAEPPKDSTTSHPAETQAHPEPPVIGSIVLYAWVDDSVIRQGQDEAARQSPEYQEAFRKKLERCIGSDPAPSSKKQKRCVNRAHRAGRNADTSYVGEEGMLPDFGGPIVRPITP